MIPGEQIMPEWRPVMSTQKVWPLLQGSYGHRGADTDGAESIQFHK